MNCSRINHAIERSCCGGCYGCCFIRREHHNLQITIRAPCGNRATTTLNDHDLLQLESDLCSSLFQSHRVRVDRQRTNGDHLLAFGTPPRRWLHQAVISCRPFRQARGLLPRPRSDDYNDSALRLETRLHFPLFPSLRLTVVPESRKNLLETFGVSLMFD